MAFLFTVGFLYVPGGSFVNHCIRPRIGMHGVMGDQNNYAV